MADDRRVWLIGASSGIGHALAERLLAAGCRVAVSARSREKLEGLASVPDASRCLVVPLDVTDAVAVGDAARTVERAFGGLDLVIINAGTYSPNTGEGIVAADYESVFDVNVFGAVRVLEHVVPMLTAQASGGHVAVTASLTGYVGLPHGSPYSATKAALISMCESLRAELAPKNVAVTVINPGFVKTPLTDRNDFPMPFLIDPERAAAIIERGLSDRRFEIRFPWQTALAMRLARALPYPLYFRLARRMVRSDT